MKHLFNFIVGFSILATCQNAFTYHSIPYQTQITTDSTGSITPPSQGTSQNIISDTYASYYTLPDAPSAPNISGFVDPMEMFTTQSKAVADKAISLINWIFHNEPMPTPQTPYMRTSQFGRWINDPTDDTCMNTRAKVLVRDSEAQVTYKNEKNCVVQNGQWHDPYSNSDMTTSRQVQIDHLVPLKHAYITGAWKWDYRTRCLYANFMGNNYHLLSVSGHENMSKGDKSPDKYIPPEQTYRCEYLKNWLQVKATWKLAITKDEADGIQEEFKNNNCKADDFNMSTAEILAQRQFIQSNINFCIINNR